VIDDGLEGYPSAISLDIRETSDASSSTPQGERAVTTFRRTLCIGAFTTLAIVVPASVSGATQNPATGQQGITAGFNCATPSAPVERGHAASAPGSAFNETSPGTAGTVYAGNGPGSTAHAGSTAAVSQYDAACQQLSSH
jgi:hypothetical protein